VYNREVTLFLYCIVGDNLSKLLVTEKMVLDVWSRRRTQALVRSVGDVGEAGSVLTSLRELGVEPRRRTEVEVLQAAREQTAAECEYGEGDHVLEEAWRWTCANSVAASTSPIYRCARTRICTSPV
jgi:hypothetical protein